MSKLFIITAHTNNRARLIVSESHTTDAELVDVIRNDLRARGYWVEVREVAD